ncbi:UNVERIFIED_CONTAM: hypothetical protein K2H54_019750 [Gekko kuhli]
MLFNIYTVFTAKSQLTTCERMCTPLTVCRNLRTHRVDSLPQCIMSIRKHSLQQQRFGFQTALRERRFPFYSLRIRALLSSLIINQYFSQNLKICSNQPPDRNQRSCEEPAALTGLWCDTQLKGL